MAMDGPLIATPVALVLAGGIGLGAYQAGAYETLQAASSEPDWVCGSSVGGVTAALIAGNAAADRLTALRRFWNIDDGPLPETPDLRQAFDPFRHAHNWASALQARLFGSRGHFRPRLGAWPLGDFQSLYDLSPMRARIEELIDFERLNRGDIRVTVAMTDIETGEPVFVDTRDGDLITPDHLLASCGFLPEFAPVEINGRLLGDGGLSVNAPIEPVLSDPATGGTCFVIDLYARDGMRPRTLQAAMERKSDLIFGNQTWQRLDAFRRERQLRTQIAALAAKLQTEAPEHGERDVTGLSRPAGTLHVLHLSYRAQSDDAGPEKAFDLSDGTIRRRWRDGALDMALALDTAQRAAPSADGAMIVHSIRRDQ
jgi:NTE family protein